MDLPDFMQCCVEKASVYVPGNYRGIPADYRELPVPLEVNYAKFAARRQVTEELPGIIEELREFRPFPSLCKLPGKGNSGRVLKSK